MGLFDAQTRRRFIATAMTLPLLGAAKPRRAMAAHHEDDAEHQIFWGDLHNHNAVGYAKGSLERSFEIAHSLLDFYAFTPHSFWHDMPEVDAATRKKFHTGFDTVKARWPEVLDLCEQYHKPGTFVTFPGYEWHSSGSGDYCLIFPDGKAPLIRFQDLDTLQTFAKEKGIIMIPHHPGNNQGNRGANFGKLDIDVSPVLEIYSEWGCAERDDSPFPYIRHSHGGVSTTNTLQHALKSGLRLGVVASTDDHFGYPGAYREGLAAVIAPELTRASIYQALKQKRTYAVTGDRIALDYRLNGRRMGSSIPYAKMRELSVEAAGWDAIESVEVLKNNKVVHRDHPIDRATSAASWKRPVLLRIQFGWGPWASLGAARICDWDFKVDIEGGVINSIQPCFQSGPFSETKRDKIHERTKSACKVQSFTSRYQAFAEDDTKGVVLNVSGGPETRIALHLDAPVKMQFSAPLKDLVEANAIIETGPYPSESIRIHRLVFEEHYKTAFTLSDAGEKGGADWYYLRVKQANGQMAWSSPIWVG